MSSVTPIPKQIHEALLDAFRDEDDLARMVNFRLKENLNAIAGGENLAAKAFALIEWAAAQGKLEALISGAIAENPGNHKLQALVQDTPRNSVESTTAADEEVVGDNIGGDKVGGDKVAGHKTVINNNYFGTQPVTPADQPQTTSPQQPAASPQPPLILESPMGTMPPESPFYIERPADGECNQIFQSGNPFTLYIQAPRQMGKSSLMQRILHAAQKERSALNVAFVDFEKFSSTQLGDIDQFLIGLCLMIGRELKVPERIDDYWASKYQSPLIKCSDYIFDYLLGSVEGHAVIAMDEVEKVLGLPFQDDFFGMLRTWHNDRARDKNMARCCLFLSSSTEPELFIENPNQSPFNVAHLMLLKDFDQESVQRLNVLHGAPLEPSEVNQLYAFLNGHPYLTRQALYTIANSGLSYQTMVEQAVSEDSPFKTHLQNLWRHVEERAELRTALGQILNNGKYPADRTYYRLKGAGLVMRKGGNVRVCNQLYADYFSQRINI